MKFLKQFGTGAVIATVITGLSLAFNFYIYPTLDSMVVFISHTFHVKRMTAAIILSTPPITLCTWLMGCSLSNILEDDDTASPNRFTDEETEQFKRL